MSDAVRVWWLRRLTCTGCAKVTYRAPRDRRPCGWCGGTLEGRA